MHFIVTCNLRLYPYNAERRNVLGYASSMTSRFPSALEMSFRASGNILDAYGHASVYGHNLSLHVLWNDGKKDDDNYIDDEEWQGCRGRLSIWRWPILFFSRPPACYAPPLIDPFSSSLWIVNGIASIVNSLQKKNFPPLSVSFEWNPKPLLLLLPSEQSFLLIETKERFKSDFVFLRLTATDYLLRMFSPPPVAALPENSPTHKQGCISVQCGLGQKWAMIA